MSLLARLNPFARGAVAPAAGRAATSPEGGEPLFDDDFQRKLDYLAMVSRRVFAGRMRAERRTKKSGSGIEFADHREYQPGDDFRTLDWNVYQRFGKLLVRLYEEEEDLQIDFVIDASPSMAFGDGRKLRHAKRVCAGLAYVGLSNLDRVGILATGYHDGDRAARRLPKTRGKGRIFTVLRFLEATGAGGETDLEATMRTFVAENKRRGLCVVLSDLYDPHGFERGINVLRYAKFEPFVVHITDETEARPKLHGDVLLEDCETGDTREVTVTAKVLNAFEASYRGYLEEVARFCAGKQVPYARADVSVPVDELILRVFRGGGFLR